MEPCALLALGGVFAASLWLYLRSAAEPVPIVGEALIGTPGVVSVPVPRGGVGVFAYVVGGRRVTRPCRAAAGVPLARGTRVRVADLRGGLVVVTFA